MERPRWWSLGIAALLAAGCGKCNTDAGSEPPKLVLFAPDSRTLLIAKNAEESDVLHREQHMYQIGMIGHKESLGTWYDPWEINFRAFTVDRKRLIEVNRVEIGVRDVETGKTVRTIKLKEFDHLALSAASADGSRLDAVQAANNGRGISIAVWDTSTWEVLGTPIEGLEIDPTAMAFTPDLESQVVLRRLMLWYEMQDSSNHQWREKMLLFSVPE